jgi:hypothetical protein
MSLQTANNVQVAYKVQSGLNAPASGAGATGIFVAPSPGLGLQRAVIDNPTIRNDGQSTKGRLGTKKGGAVYNHVLGVGSADAWLEAIMRGTFVASLAITNAAMTSITTTTNTIVAAGGSWLTQGVRVGDKVKLTGHSTAANNGKWLRVLGVTASTLTLPTGALTLDATPDASFTLTVAKTVSMGNVDRYFSLEDVGQDIDASEYGTDMKLCKLEISAQPDANVMATFTFMGRDVQAMSGVTSPVFTSPTYTTTLPLVMADGTIRVGGVDYAVLTGFSFILDRGGDAPSVLAPNAPDIFLANAKLSGSFSAYRQDLTFLSAFSNETTVDFFVDMVENEADPKDFVSWYVGNATLAGNTKQIAASGGMVETVPWFAGTDATGGDRVATMLKMATSAP